MQQEQLNIRDVATARIFEDRNRVRLLEPFIQEPRTLSDAATKLGIKAPHLHYHVKKFLDRGLLEIVGATKRNGRTVKLYQTTARAFFVPFELTSSETLEKFITGIFASSHARGIRNGVRSMESIAPDWGFRWMGDDEGNLYFEMLPLTMSKEVLENVIFAEDTPAQLSFSVTYNLEHETAKAFQRDLRALAEQYFAAQKPDAREYDFQITLVPLLDS